MLSGWFLGKFTAFIYLRLDLRRDELITINRLLESPRWLYRHERNDQALQVLCDVFDRAPIDEKVVCESEGILEAIEFETLHGEYK